MFHARRNCEHLFTRSALVRCFVLIQKFVQTRLLSTAGKTPAGAGSARAATLDYLSLIVGWAG
eukprot:135589-Pyramimonas_sp.AAC.1